MGCAVCGIELEQPRTGRRRKYCSPGCRDAKYRVVHEPRLCGCGREFVPSHGNQRHCSDECRFVANGAHVVFDRSRACPICRKPFVAVSRSHTFCSRPCLSRSKYLEKGGGVAATCADCGEPFIRQSRGCHARCPACRDRRQGELADAARDKERPRPYGGPMPCGWCVDPVFDNREFCSPACRGRATRRSRRVCSTCGLDWRPKPGRPFGSAATECWHCRSRHHVEGGKSWHGIKLYRRKQLLKRAEGRCEDCGTSEGPFEAHHIVPQSMGGSHAIENLKLLCEDCHSGSGWARNHAVLVEAGLVVPPADVQLALAA